MSNNIIIRKANDSDLEGILALINAPEIDNGTAMEMRDANTVYQSILDDPNYFQVVACTEEGIIALITLVIIMKMTHEGSTTALITDLIISESTSEKAEVAVDLMKHTTDLAQEYGCHKTIFQNDYHHALIESSCQVLGFEKGSQTFELPE